MCFFFFGGPQAEVRPTKKIKSHVIEFFGGPQADVRPTKKIDSTVQNILARGGSIFPGGSACCPFFWWAAGQSAAHQKIQSHVIYFFGGPQVDVRPTKKMDVLRAVHFFGGPHMGLRPTKKFNHM